MVKTVAASAVVAAMMTGGAARADASPGPELVVVVHVTSYAQVSRSDLTEAERLATRVYGEAGVRMIWTDHAAAAAPRDDAFHVDVILLSKEMMVHKCQEDGIGEVAFGSATQLTRRAYVFYSRIEDHAHRTQAAVSHLLAGVVVHEVGHVLLPANGHSESGIMRGRWEGRIVRLPGFTDAQATMIRSRLAPASASAN